MPYTLQRFGSVYLPTGMPVTPIGTGETVSGAVQLVDGAVFDSHGTDKAPLRLPYDLTYRAMFWSTTTALLSTAVNALKAMRGKVDELYRLMPDGNNHWCTARLVSVRGEREVTNLRHQEIELSFQVMSPWYGNHHGAHWHFGDGPEFGDGHCFGESDQYYLDQRAVNYSAATGTFTIGETITGSGSGATGALIYDTGTALVLDGVTGNYLATDTLTGSSSGVTADADSVSYAATYIVLGNGGDATVENCLITVDVPAGSPNITSLTIISPALSTFTYNGTVLAGKQLIIDVGAWSVLNNNADDYDGLERNAGHAIFPWLQLASGGAWVGIARTGGDDDCTITFDYSDRWE